ncbi:MAG: hypothetical protein JOZ22_15260, partial [Acidobacteriia bacterium]|nr:hypothetical protein [Terriglobia bacterium]
MINGSDTEIPFQWVSSCWDPSAILGCIEIQDSLPAGATQTYTLEAGPPAATVTNPIVVSNGVPCYGGGGATCIQITNGRTGLQVPTVASNNAAAAYRQAPIQGIMLPNGQWTGAYNGAGPNIIYAENPTGVVSLSLASPITTATGYRAKFLQYGPMKTVLQLAYQFNRPNYMTTNGYFFNVSCNPATNSISFGGGVVPAGATVLFSSNNFCPVAGGSAPLDSQHYYVATAVPGSSTNYTLTTSGIPVNITGSITTSTRAVFVLNSTTGCAAGCLNSSPGRLIVTFTIYANSRAILVTEDSDMEHSEYYPFYNEVAPDTARFRNNLGNGSADPRCGYQTPIAVTAVGSANGTATITLGGGNTASNGELIYLTGVGSGSTLPNGIYYLQTTSPFSATSPGVWTSGSLTGATSPPASYSGSGLVKLPTYQLQQQNSQDWGFDMPWVYDSSFSYAEPILNAGTGCSLSGGHLYSTSPLEVNYPVSEYNAVWSWQNYQVNGSSTSPVLGWFSGDAGLMQNAKYGSMPGLLAADNNGGPNTSIQNSNFV